MNAPLFLLNNNANQAYFGYGVQAHLQFDDQVDLDAVDAFIAKQKEEHIFTLLAYDLKNSVEQLHSNHHTVTPAPHLLMVVPEVIVKEENGMITCVKGEWTEELQQIFQNLKETKSHSDYPFTFQAQTTQADYLQTVKQLQHHIQIGDIYEVNYCQNFVSKNNAPFDPKSIYQTVNGVTGAPFSAYVEWENFALACGSPERYIEKKGEIIRSQPIKGTAKRGQTEAEDENIKTQLYNDPKERAENVMIVDLVRNDLSRIAQKGSVHVPELFGIYTFPTVHQMISTIECKVDESVTFGDILKATYPMGSMTGAPKIRAMHLIEQYENFKRGIYSGSVGILFPNGDFDLNVVIRSIVMNLETYSLTCSVGGAITIDAIPENEWNECKTKISRILAPFQCQSEIWK